MINKQQKLEDRLKKISDLQVQRDAIDSELLKLTGLSDNSENLSQSLPSGLILMDEIKKVMEEKDSKMKILDVKKALDKKHNVNLLRRNVQGAMVYMVKKGILEKKKEERGLFSLKSEIVVEKT